MDIKVVDLGRMEYERALRIQEMLLSLRQKGDIGDYFLLVEHEPVITVGKRGNSSNILLPEEMLAKLGVNIFEVTRGGDVTYHGPGQIVGYFILNLDNYGKSIKLFIHNLEEVFIRLLNERYGVHALRADGKYTGVWVNDDKITAIGIAVQRHVTMHGFAFNVNTDLSHFKWINPCGITDKGVTSLEKITGNKQDINTVKKQIVSYFAKVYNIGVVYEDLDELIERLDEYLD